MTSELQTPDRTLQISGTVFVYACLVLVLVSLVAAAGGIALGISASASENKTSDFLLQTKNELLQCNSEVARLGGRLQTFEGLLIRPHQAALEASLKLFLLEQGKSGKEVTLEEYVTWIRKK